MIVQSKEERLSPVGRLRLTLSISRKHGRLRARNVDWKYTALCGEEAWNVGISYQSAHMHPPYVLHVISCQRRPCFRVLDCSVQAYTKLVCTLHKGMLCNCRL